MLSLVSIGAVTDIARLLQLSLTKFVQRSPIQSIIGSQKMRQIRYCVAVLAACLSLSTLATPATAGCHQSKIESAIKAENARWAEAYARGDYEAVGRLYTKDGALLPPGGDRIRGANAITAYFTKASAGSAPDTVLFSNYEFYGNDQVVTEVSDAEIHDQSGNLKYRGKQILIFLKQGGAWKLHRDIWNESAP